VSCFKNYLKGIDGIASYPVFSLVVFFLFFVSLAAWLIFANTKRMKEISRLPLDENSQGDKAIGK
jgi:hypothetical protein